MKPETSVTALALIQLSPAERPRERLVRHGAELLTSAELLALVLGTGNGTEDVLQLAHRILDQIGGVEALAAATLHELTELPGIGLVKGARIRAAFALAYRAQAAALEADREAAFIATSPPIESLDCAVERLRRQVSPSERAVVGYHVRGAMPPITLALGEPLGPRSRLGSYLARLLSEGVGPWWVIVLRPGDGPPRDIERVRAVDLLEAAHLVGVDLEQVVLVYGSEHTVLAAVAAVVEVPL